MKTLLLALLAIGCCAAEPGRDPSTNCEQWDDMRRGVVSCEQLGDRCAYSSEFASAPLTTNSGWMCTCGGESSEIRLYWCKRITPPQSLPAAAG